MEVGPSFEDQHGQRQQDVWSRRKPEAGFTYSTASESGREEGDKLLWSLLTEPPQDSMAMQRSP